MKLTKIFCAAVFTLCAATASAQNDSVKVVMDFDANPWGYAVAEPKGTSYSKYDLDDPANEPAYLRKPTDFTAEANGVKVTMTVTPSDIDETDYDNCLFHTFDYDVDMSGDTRINVLRMAIGSTMKFTAPEDYRFAKMEFNNFRTWASGGIGSFGYTWTAETPHIYQNVNDKGEVTWEVDAWIGDETSWHTPACTGTTMLRNITIWLLPAGSTGISASMAESAKVNVTRLDGVVVRKNVSSKDATAGLANGVYLVDGKKVVVNK